MSHPLDTKRAFETFDTGRIAESIGLSIDQLESVIGQPRRLFLKPRHRNARSIVVCGMGGSNLGSEVLLNVFRDRIRVPVVLHRDYGLPSFVGHDTLVIAASYSGNTEETVSSINEAHRRGCPIIGIATGGQIADLCQRYRAPFFHIDGGLNPSDQPRLGLGYAMGGLLTILRNAGYLLISHRALIAPLSHVRHSQRGLLPLVPHARNTAKQLASQLHKKVPVIISAEHLSGTGRVFANMVNENAKMFAVPFSLPEINHHLIEGLSYPTTAKKQLVFLFLESDHYHRRIKLRQTLTKKIVKKAGIDVRTYKPTSLSTFGEALEVVQFAGYVTFYLAILNRVNPALIPWVNYLKKNLAKK